MATLVDAARSGDRRATLECLRDELAESIDRCESGRDMAALSKRLIEVMDELDGIAAPEADTPLERAKRRSAD